MACGGKDLQSLKIAVRPAGGLFIIAGHYLSVTVTKLHMFIALKFRWEADGLADKVTHKQFLQCSSWSELQEEMLRISQNLMKYKERNKKINHEKIVS